MQKVALLISCCLIMLLTISFVTRKKEKVKWLTVTELQTAYNNERKPILIDVYTGWCGWCKVMDRQTYNSDNVATYINSHFYALKLDAEDKQTLEWNGRKYAYNAAAKSNDLAVYFLNGEMSFPTTVFLSSLDAQPAALAGYLRPKEIEAPLKFFGEGVYKTKTFTQFNDNFTVTW
jgi:uncharacterized protein YyaL (SSP411 family)